MVCTICKAFKKLNDLRFVQSASNLIFRITCGFYNL